MSAPEIRPYDPSYPYDELTGLLKRAHAFPLIEKLVEEGREFGLILADIDRCAYLNQDYGPAASDWAILRLAEAIQAQAGTDAIACRTAGDKFLICPPGPTDAQQAAETMRAAARNAKVEDHDGEQVPTPTITFGVALFPKHGRDLESLLCLLDEAVYQGKRASRDCVVLAGNA
jgi:diguanylate cyclase (GGDEF)-like protein